MIEGIRVHDEIGMKTYDSWFLIGVRVCESDLNLKQHELYMFD